MKRIISLFLAFVITVLSLAGCGVIKEGKDPTISTPTTPPTPTPEKPGDEEEIDLTPFTVTIIDEEGAPYVDTDGMQAQWKKGNGEIHRADFVYDETTGKSTAQIVGLDGDYSVTILGLSTKYLYDANAYNASNVKRDTVVEVFKFVKSNSKSGADLYENAKKISRLGGYTATLTSRQPYVFYEFTPPRAGIYYIDTICDITANEINPSFLTYTGNQAAKYESKTIDSGATEGSYTRNVRYEINVPKEGVGRSFTFKITATHRDGTNKYPYDVSFLVRYIRDNTPPPSDDNTPKKTVIKPDYDALEARGEIMNPVGKMTMPETKISDGVYLFDGDMFGLNDDDGFYHLYNEATGKFDGPIVYARIRAKTRFFYDYLPQGAQVPNEVAFVSGFPPDNPNNNDVISINVMSDNLGNLENGTEDYNSFVAAYGSYISYENNPDGVYPVTEELKIFLNKFSVSQRYFMDGNGWAETTAENDFGYKIYAAEEDQWLFACCYYV